MSQGIISSVPPSWLPVVASLLITECLHFSLNAPSTRHISCFYLPKENNYCSRLSTLISVVLRLSTLFIIFWETFVNINQLIWQYIILFTWFNFVIICTYKAFVFLIFKTFIIRIWIWSNVSVFPYSDTTSQKHN